MSFTGILDVLKTTTSNNTSNATSMATAPQSVSDVAGVFGMLLSFSAVRDWLKLILMGGVFEICRTSTSDVWQYLSDMLWVTATFDSEGESYEWIMFWLSLHPLWDHARRVEVTTRHAEMRAHHQKVSDDEAKHMMTYIPSLSGSYGMWHNGNYITIARAQVSTTYWETKESLTVRILSRDRNVLTKLVLEARETYETAKQHSISIYVADTNSNWRRVASRPKRPLDSIVLDPGVKEELLNDAREFMESRKWYSERGIPYRRGYLLYGVPGSGKSSIIQGLAGELGLNVYIISLSRSGMDDSTLNQVILDLPEKCIALMEDIDAAFRPGIARDLPRQAQAQPVNDNPEAAPKPKVEESGCRVTLSGLLNALDGVGAQEGRILYATTNCYDALDPALCRPGRMDVHMEFKLASKFQVRMLFERFYMSSTSSESDADEDEKDDTDTEMETSDSGFSSLAPSVSAKLVDVDSSAPEKRSSTSLPSRRETRRLAARFARIIPDRGFSMASLQGYLMTYKTNPYNAVRDAAAWVEAQSVKTRQITGGEDRNDHGTSRGVGMEDGVAAN